MSTIGDLYEFVFRGQLADSSLDGAGRPSKYPGDLGLDKIADVLSIEIFEPELIEPARRMSVVYAAIAAFENGVRQFISRVLLDAFGANWWELGVSDKIRKFAESRRDEEEKTRWHGVRSDDLLGYTDLGQLANIIQNNFQYFEPYVKRSDWSTSVLSGVERSRNVIMHSGFLEMEDVERLGIFIRDWIKQVGL